MKTTTEQKTVQTKPRNILTYEPPTHVAAMISHELTRDVPPGGKPASGALKKIFTESIVSHLGPKYPKILAQYKLSTLEADFA